MSESGSVFRMSKLMVWMSIGIAFFLLVLTPSLGNAASAKKKKFHEVKLQRMLSVRTQAEAIGDSLFRYAWHGSVSGREVGFSDRAQFARVFRFNRTSCKSIQFGGGQKDNSYFGDARPEMVVLVEGLPAQVWTIPLDSLGFSPLFKLRPGHAAIIKVRPTVDDGASHVYLGGAAQCRTRSGKA